MSTSLLNYITLGISFIAASASVLAAIKTASAAKAANLSANTSAEQLKTQISNQEKIERPRLVPLNVYVTPNTYNILSDWNNYENNTSFKDFTVFYSNLKIPIINTGKSFAIDVDYSFSLIGEIPNYSSDNVKVNFESEESTDDDLIFTVTEFKEKPVLKKFRVYSYTEYIPLIKSNEISEMYIPNYFVVLCNVYSKEYPNFALGSKDSQENNKNNRPKLRLVIRYKDQYDKRHIDEYVMELSGKSFIEGEDAHIFGTHIDFNLAGTKKLSDDEV